MTHDSTTMPGDAGEDFVRLLGQHEQSLLAYVLALIPDWHAAQDLVQATRVKLWRQFAQYDRTKCFGAWARTIAYYEVLHYRTRQAREKLQFHDELVSLLQAEANRAAEHTDARQDALMQCVETLKPAQKRLLAQCYLDDKPYRQVAAEEGRSYEAVRKGLLRIRQLLHQCIERRLQREAS